MAAVPDAAIADAAPDAELADATIADATQDAAPDAELDAGPPDSGPDSGPDAGCWSLSFEQPGSAVESSGPLYGRTGQLVVEAWIRLDEVPTTTQAIAAWPVRLEDRAAFELDVLPGGALRYCVFGVYEMSSQVWCVPSPGVATSTTVQPGRWTHVLGAYYSTPEALFVFQDGLQASGGFGPDLLEPSPDTFTAGDAPGISGREYLHGAIAALKIDNGTPQHYLNLMTFEPFVPDVSFDAEPYTLLLWRFDEGSGTRTHDLSMHAHTGTTSARWIPGGPPCD